MDWATLVKVAKVVGWKGFREVLDQAFADMPRLMLALNDPSAHFKQPEISA